MGTLASPAAAAALRAAVVISWLQTSSAKQRVGGKASLLLHEGLWSMLVPLCCASERLLSGTVLPRASCTFSLGLWCFPSSPRHPNPEYLVPLGALGLVGKEPVPREPCWDWPPWMLEAACLAAGGTAVRCGKHEKIPNKAELVRESKRIHTENVACPKLSESQPLMWESPWCPQKSLGLGFSPQYPQFGPWCHQDPLASWVCIPPAVLLDLPP